MVYAMIRVMDRGVQRLREELRQLGLEKNTLLLFTSDNGPAMYGSGDLCMRRYNCTFAGGKGNVYEGGIRVPMILHWPDGGLAGGQRRDEFVHFTDWLPTLLAAAGDNNIKEKLLKGYQAIGRTYKVHLDGYNFLPYLTGKEDKGPRDEIFYFSDDGDLTALRYQDWKLIFMEQRVEATLQAWAEPFVPLRVPLIFNLRRDPYERSQKTSNTYYDWLLDRAFLLVPAQDYVGRFLATFKEFPPRQKAASFSLDQVMEKIMTPVGSP